MDRRKAVRFLCWGPSHRTGNPAGLPACPNAPPISLLVLPKEKRAVHGPKRKNALTRSGAVALRATGVGVSVPAPILPCLRARLGLLRGQYCRPVPDGADLIGVVVALNCFSFRCRWPVVDGASATGRCGHRPLRGCRGPARRGGCPHPSAGTDPHDRHGSA